MYAIAIGRTGIFSSIALHVRARLCESWGARAGGRDHETNAHVLKFVSFLQCLSGAFRPLP